MSVDKKSELKIRAIENGTVIDHITANKSLHILKILGLPDSETKNVTVAMNVSSKEIGRKDIVKIENRELKIKKYVLNMISKKLSIVHCQLSIILAFLTLSETTNQWKKIKLYCLIQLLELSNVPTQNA